MRHRVLSTVVPLRMLGAVLMGSVTFGTLAHAQVTKLTVNKCLAGKIKSVGKSLAARTGCLSKETSTGIDNSSCPQKASDRSAWPRSPDDRPRRVLAQLDAVNRVGAALRGRSTTLGAVMPHLLAGCTQSAGAW